MNGVNDTQFAPDAEISRQDLAAIIMRYAEFAGEQFPVTLQYATFEDDADISDYAKSAVQALMRATLSTGSPATSLTRRATRRGQRLRRCSTGSWRQYDRDNRGGDFITATVGSAQAARKGSPRASFFMRQRRKAPSAGRGFFAICRTLSQFVA
ncbi:MAG: hypothetical protein LBJ10_02500, partial [Clostridiales bacterium]|nr:hypothetical protein [Clostridiales bacterium]